MTDHKFEFLTVEIHGLDEPVAPLDTEGKGTSGPVQVNGKCGRAVGWSDENEKYWVQTFDGVIVPVAEDNLKEYTPPAPQDGGFDLLWPFHQETFFEFAMEVSNAIVTKGYCLMQLNKTDASRKAALRKANRQVFTLPREEFLSDYLGRKGSGKISEIDPLKLSSVQEILEQSLEDLPEDGLTKYDLDISSLFGALGPMTLDTMGFTTAGRTEPQTWMPFQGTREATTMQAEPLSDEDIEDGVVERHLRFLRRRKLCFLYMIENEGGKLSLHPREDLNQEPVEIPIEKARLLVYRCDLMQIRYQPDGNHVTLQAWALEEAPKYEIKDMNVPAVCRDEAFGVLAGPKVPNGELSRVMAIAVLAGGGCYDLAKCSSMYMSGVDGHTYVANTRFDTDLYMTKDGDNDHRPFENSYHHHGAFAPDADLFGFDCDFFGYSVDQASLMSPNQRLVLELGYQCLYNAGYTRPTLRGAPIFVYLGDCGNEWWHYNELRMWSGERNEKSHLDWSSPQTFSVTASRLSYIMGMKGPHWLTDTACSSGLTAFCTAMYSMKKATKGQECTSVNLHSKECLSGGANMIVDAGVYLANCAQHMLSVKGRCFTFDVGGDGYARGEGISLAYNILSESDKDAEVQIGVAIGNKVNQDGRSASMTAPNGPSQQLCIKASLKEAGVDPHDITCSECHGTGTSLGDPIEVGSLRGVQEMDDRENALMCTSSKSNIGHLEAAAGSTGLFKCLLQNMYGFATPNCHMRSLNPHLDAAGWPAYFQSEMCDYSAHTGLVGVSSFGISGTNAHAEAWGQCRSGPRKATIIQDPQRIDQVLLTCPITMGPIDHLTGEPASRFQNRAVGDRKKYKANVLRDDLAPYEISSHIYEGGYRYRFEDEMEDGDEPVDPGMPVCVVGSWSGWHKVEEMEKMDDGSYVATMILGESRCESFYICLSYDKSIRLFPIVDRANSRIHVMGPDEDLKFRHWLIDGRDDEIPAGTCYQIHFSWTKERKACFWEEVGPKHASKAVRFDHRYSIMGSWTAYTCDLMMKDPQEDGVFEYITRIGYTGEEQFHFCRDGDQQQIIYPAEPNCQKTTIPVRGPDGLCGGKYWVVKGAVGEQVTIKLEIDDGKVVVAIISETRGEKVYESKEGLERHEYCLGGSWNDWEWIPMTPDTSIAGVYRGTGTIGGSYADDYHAYVDFFNIAVDGDPKLLYFPEVSYSASGTCTVNGPGIAEDSPWMVKGWTAGAAFEVVLDLTAIDRRKIVTWSFVGGKSFSYGLNTFENGNLAGGDIPFAELVWDGGYEDEYAAVEYA